MSIVPPEVKNTLIKIKKFCKPYLQQNKEPLDGNALYRGLGTSTADALTKSVQVDKRPPMTTPLVVHNAVNDYFISEFGEPFRNSIFCTGNRRRAKGYGNLYVIFPIGSFDYLWSPKVIDLFYYWQNINFKLKGEDEDNPTNETINGFINHLKMCGYTASGLDNAIDSNREIMIRCHQYYAIRWDSLPYDPYDHSKMHRLEAFLRR